MFKICNDKFFGNQDLSGAEFHRLLPQNDQDFRQRFLREARIGQKIRHPHLVPIHEVIFEAQGLALDRYHN